MPYVSTGTTGFGGFLSGLADLASAAAPIVGQFTGRPAAPVTALPGGALQVAPAALDLPGLQVPFTGQTLQSPLVSNQSVMMRSPFRPTMAGAAAQIFVAENPVSGKATWFGPLGRPILWSRDLTTCKRVRKIGARARRAGGR